MGLLVNAAIGALAGVVGSLLSVSVLGSGMAVPLGLLFALGGFFAAGSMLPSGAAVAATGKAGRAKASELEEAAGAKAAKKAKKAAAEKAKKEAAELAKAEEAAAKAAAKKAAEKAKKKNKKAAVVESESSDEESEAEEVAAAADSAPKSKSALKKAKAKAKAAAEKAEAEAAAKAAEKAAKKKNKKGAKETEAAAPAAAAAAAAPAAAKKSASAAAAEKAAAKAAAEREAADAEGWQTIEAPKPTKSQVKKAEEAVSPVASAKGKKAGSVPSSERELTEEIIIPAKHIPLIIGNKGATLETLQSGSGARIDMPKRDSGSSKIQITGTPAQVASARNAIESLATRGFSNLTHPGTLSDEMTVEPDSVGLILGAKGANLKAIQDATQTRINLPEKNSSSKKVTIVGEKEGVKAAKAALRQLVADGFSPITHPTWIKVEMDFPADKMSILIGKKGQTIKSIQGDTKARINLPEKNTKSSTISVCGPADAVAKAEKQINKLLEPLEPLPEPEDHDLATDDAWGQQHTAGGEDDLW